MIRSWENQKLMSKYSDQNESHSSIVSTLNFTHDKRQAKTEVNAVFVYMLANYWNQKFYGTKCDMQTSTWKCSHFVISYYRNNCDIINCQHKTDQHSLRSWLDACCFERDVFIMQSWEKQKGEEKGSVDQNASHSSFVSTLNYTLYPVQWKSIQSATSALERSVLLLDICVIIQYAISAWT